MLRALLLIGVPILIIFLVVLLIGGPLQQPQQPTSVYYNGTHLIIENARSFEYNGKAYGPGNYAIRAPNGSLLYLKINGRTAAYRVGYAYKVVYYDGVKGVVMAYVQNLGNATLKFLGATVQTSGEVEVPASAVKVAPPAVYASASPERCTPQSCTAWISVRVEAPYAGRFQALVGGQPLDVEVNRTGYARVEVPYGYRVPVELRPWFYELVRVAPEVNATLIRTGDVVCTADSCVYPVVLRLWAQVPTDFYVYAPGGMYTASVKARNGTATLRLQLPPDATCVSVVPPARDVCITLPDRPAKLVVESVQWYYYSYSSVVAVLALYNPGLHKYASDVACEYCGPPGQEELSAVSQVYYGVAPLGRTIAVPPLSRVQVAVKVGTAGGALALENGTRVELRPPPMPAAKCTYKVEERPGSGGLQPFPSWAVTKHVYVVVEFSAPNVYYQNFVKAYAGNYSMPVVCSGQVCTAVVPVEAVLVDKSRPVALLGWRYVGNRTDVAVPTTAFIISPWCTVKIR